MRVVLVVSTIACSVSASASTYLHDQGRTLKSGLDDVERMNSKCGYQASRQPCRELY
jgi:hypothetical protein